MKKKLITIIVVVALVACVSATFAIWLGDVKKTQAYTINMTDNYMYISSQNLAFDDESPKILLPATPVTHKFELKLKGTNAIAKLECVDIQFSVDGGVTYKPVAKDALGVTFDKNDIIVNHGNADYLIVTCKSTIKFLLPATELDNIYENAKFKYTIRVSIAEREVTNG